MSERISDEDILKTDKSLQDFFDSLGPNDIYKRVFLEVLLEEIYGRRVDLSNVIKDDVGQQPASPSHLPSTTLPGSLGAHEHLKTLPS